MAQVYFILGLPDSGRRELVRFLIDSGLSEDDVPVLVLQAKGEPENAVDERLRGRPNTTVQSYTIGEHDAIDFPAIPDDTRTLFLLADSQANPVEQVDSLKAWLDAEEHELARVITVVNCALAERIETAQRYHDACIHFSDVVLLGRREDVSKKWIQSFEDRFRKACYPCLLDYLKKDGIVKSPSQILFPEPRRLSLAFDLADEDEEAGMSAEAYAASLGLEIQDESGEDDDAAGFEEDDDAIPADPYLEKEESGRRVRPVPAPRSFL